METLIITETLDIEALLSNDPYFQLPETEQADYGCIG
jgi:hypothetical protein